MELRKKRDKWNIILDEADDIPALKNLLDQAEMLYDLTKKEK